jgi:hypothetical protein
MRRIILASLLGLLALPATTSAFSIRNYGVRDAGSVIRHTFVLCTDRYDNAAGRRFEVVSRVEMADGRDKRFRYSTARMPRYTCRRWTQEYDDVLKYRGWYWGRVRVRLMRTDWVQYTRWRRFWSS